MATRKYAYFVIVTEFERNQYENYHDAVHEYHTAESATLYGVNIFDDWSVIYSK